ncbi:MAG: substrate-binding domain-containing protein [Lachnospiraceae bacterium]
MKRILVMAALMVSAGLLTACGGRKQQDKITVISREDGSGTRGAFVELFGIEQKDEAGEKFDMTTEEAEITNSTAVIMTSVVNNDKAIGYLSLGSLNDSVKAVAIDGSEATAENIQSGSYQIARPFLLATKDSVSDVAADFMSFVLSEQGQRIVEDNHYISQGNAGSYKAGKLSGKVVVGGSSSVTPVMEKLKEAYVILNPDVVVEIQQSDSTTGMTSVAEGLSDLGMASRDLKDSEREQGLKAKVIAMDGIAVIVNLENPVDDLASQAVKDIYTGQITDWSQIK